MYYITFFVFVLFCFGCFLTRYLIFSSFYCCLLPLSAFLSLPLSLFIYVFPYYYVHLLLFYSSSTCSIHILRSFILFLSPSHLFLFVSIYAQIIFHIDIQHSDLSHQAFKVCGNRPNSSSSFPWQLKCLASKGFFCRVPHPVHDDILWVLRIGVKTH